MATGSSLTQNHSRSQSEIQGDLHMLIEELALLPQELLSNLLLSTERRCEGIIEEVTWMTSNGQNQQKCSLARLESLQIEVQSLEKIGGILLVDGRFLVLQAKRSRYQSASATVQQL
ncbi:hypothetical protein TNCV_3984611 [Trichonephila clavipes]|nr:hypothetical protein TNCV_3984611 [Trichonephila clavipes]